MFETTQMRQQRTQTKTNWTVRFAIPVRHLPEKPALHQEKPKDSINQNAAMHDLAHRPDMPPHVPKIDPSHEHAFQPMESNANKPFEAAKRMELYRMSVARKEITEAQQKHGLQLTQEQANRFIRMAGANPFALTEDGVGLIKGLKEQENKMMEIMKDDGKAPGSLKPDELMNRKAEALQQATKGINIPRFGRIKLNTKQQNIRAESLNETIRKQPKTVQMVRGQMKKWRQRHTMLTTVALRQLGRV